MTWIKTVSMDDDDRVKQAMEAQRKLYPIEYATPVHPVNDGATSGIVASHTLLPDVLFHAFSTFGALMSPDLPLNPHRRPIESDQCRCALGSRPARVRRLSK